MKILLIDIETAPNLAHVWGLWQQNVSLNQLMEPGYTLCWAAKWLGEKEVFFHSGRGKNRARMVKAIHKLLSEADAVVHYNGIKFDIPTLNKDFLLEGLAPPSPAKQIDLLRVVRQQFRFPSNKLDYVSQVLGLGKKTKHSGHDLWVKCMAGDQAAWNMMEKYNRNDVVLLEKAYLRLKPWIKSHPNHGLYEREDSLVCPKCGSNTYQARGEAKTSTCVYKRYQCCKCSGWFRGVSNIGPKPTKKFTNCV